MNDSLKNTEQEFLLWLSNVVPTQKLKDVNDSYKIINTMLVRKKIIPRFLCAVTQIETVDNALKQVSKIFGSKQLRENAILILKTYMNFLKQSKREKSDPVIEVKEDWIRFDFTNSNDFERTYPVHCSLGGNEIEGKNWARILVSIIENEIEKHNPVLEDLYEKSLQSERKGKPFFLQKKIKGYNCAELSNGYWVNLNYSIPRLLNLISALCIHCGYKKNQIVLNGIRKTYGGINTKNKMKEELNPINDDNIALERITKVIRKHYPAGMRFDKTVINLLEKYSNCKIDENLRIRLQHLMFLRNDGLFFLSSMLENKEQHEILCKEYLINKLEQFGCVTLGALFKKYTSLGTNLNIRNESDLEDYLKFLMPEEIRVRSDLKSRIIRCSNKSNDEAILQAARQVVNTIKENGAVTEDDLLLTYPYYTEVFLHELLTKRTDEVMLTKINDFLCYQSIESVQFEADISDVIKDILEDVKKLSLRPSEEILNALISVRLGYNFYEEYGITDDNTFRRIISMYYTAETKREWKSGCFVEAER